MFLNPPESFFSVLSPFRVLSWLQLAKLGQIFFAAAVFIAGVVSLSLPVDVFPHNFKHCVFNRGSLTPNGS